MDTPKIPATVSILTRNSTSTLPQALRSVADFADILVSDGGSTDATVQLAKEAGARVIFQDTSLLDSNGRLADFAAARNVCLLAAEYSWHVYVDSDEYVSPELVQEIRTIIERAAVGAYWVPRRYVWQGREVTCSPSYPNRQIRFFHADAVTTFRKPIHERIQLREGVVASVLDASLLVPVSDDSAAMRRKSNRYVAMEVARQMPITARQVRAELRTALRTTLRFTFRFLRTLGCRGTRLPFSIEWEAVRYQWALVAETVRAWRALV